MGVHIKPWGATQQRGGGGVGGRKNHKSLSSRCLAEGNRFLERKIFASPKMRLSSTTSCHTVLHNGNSKHFLELCKGKKAAPLSWHAMVSPPRDVLQRHIYYIAKDVTEGTDESIAQSLWGVRVGMGGVCEPSRTSLVLSC